jgi:hypothetical protein
MRVIERLSSFVSGIRARIWRRDGEGDELTLDQTAREPALDPAEEFVKIQRGLRRLSLASDRSGEILQAVATRLDEVQQSILNLNRPQQAALALDEAQLLHILDQLDRLMSIPDLPAAADLLVRDAKTSLLVSARWRPVARAGAKPGSADVRIAEFIGEAGTEAGSDVCIHRILEQGYRRADGTLLRPGVVIAGASPQTHHSLS